MGVILIIMKYPEADVLQEIWHMLLLPARLSYHLHFLHSLAVIVSTLHLSAALHQFTRTVSAVHEQRSARLCGNRRAGCTV